MKKSLLASAVVALFISGPGLAADMSAPVYKAPPRLAAPAYNWSGFYAGVHGGYDWARARVIDNGVLTEASVTMDAAIGGLLTGVNWQTGAFVYGLEGDFGVTNLRGKGTVAPPPPPPPPPPPTPSILTPNDYKVNLNGHIRARLGYTLLPTALVYVTGGLALANFEFREGGSPTAHSSVLTGWTIGGGMEHMFTPNLIGRAEYLYDDYGSHDFTPAPGDVYNVGFKSHTARGALIWKF